MSGPIWRMEWRLALRRRRLFLLNVGIPLLLVGPLVLGGAPPYHAAAACTVLFVLFGSFGSAIPLVRDGESGLLRRIRLTGVSGRGYLVQRAAGGALLDTVQLLPCLVLLLVSGRAGIGLWMWAPVLLIVALMVANLLGIWVAAVARSLAEGALFAAVVSLFLLHGSGVFRTGAPGSTAATLEAFLPFGSLHAIVRGALTGGGGGGLPTPTWILPGPVWGSILFGAMTFAVAPRLFERIANTPGP